MLENVFYKIINYETFSENGYAGSFNINSTIVFNQDHSIFKGHFPDLPVVPGVCMIQIIKELTEKYLKKHITLKSASNTKFLKVINPEITVNILIDCDFLDIEIVKIKAKISNNEHIYMTFQGKLLLEA